MKFHIAKFSALKAKKTVVNSSKIEGYKDTKDRSVKMKARKIASSLCQENRILHV